MRYIGSKLKLREFIYNRITQYVDKKEFIFCDLFAGTGCIGSRFRNENTMVIANDVLFCNYVINKYLIEGKELKNDLVEHVKNSPDVEGFIYKNYCIDRKYFKPENGKRIDGIRTVIEDLKNKCQINSNEYFGLITSLIDSADRVSNTTGVYSAFLKKYKSTAVKDFVFTPTKCPTGMIGTVYNEDANNLISNIQGDVLYIDPPYVCRQYARDYHVLETIARYDNPTLRGLTGVRNEFFFVSKYCYKKYALQLLEDLIKKSNFKHNYISYSNEGIVNIDDLASMLDRYGDLTYDCIGHKRFVSNLKTENKQVVEYLLHIEK